MNRRTAEDDNIMNYTSLELEIMKRRIAAKQTSIFSLDEINQELAKRQMEREAFKR